MLKDRVGGIADALANLEGLVRIEKSSEDKPRMATPKRTNVKKLWKYIERYDNTGTIQLTYEYEMVMEVGFGEKSGRVRS